MVSQEQREEAIKLLRCPEYFPGTAPLKGQETWLRIWYWPALDYPRAWIMQEPSTRARIRRVEWDHTDQLFAPRTFAADGFISGDEGRGIVDRLMALQIPAFAPRRRGIGLDGAEYEIKLEGTWENTTLMWWGTLPECWIGLKDWFDETTAIFDAALPASTLRGSA
jgi:hypothetical protein